MNYEKNTWLIGDKITAQRLNHMEDGIVGAETIAKQIVVDAYPTDTASGTMAHFEDGVNDVPVKSCVVQIEPVQEGSGDPSPENVRPISGWTGVNVSRTGKNLLPMRRGYSFPYNAAVGSVLDAETAVSNWTDEGGGVFSITLSSWARSGWLSEKISSGTTITFRNKFVSGSARTTVYVLDENFTVTRKTGVANPVSANDTFKFTFTLASNECYLAIAIVGSGQKIIVNNPQIEFGSDATAYEPYIGQVCTFTFPSEAGTVYGGTLDAVTGELVVDRAHIASYNGETLPGEWISDRDVYAAGTTPTTGAQVVYHLATPITYHLTPQEITTLLGANNIWADCGAIDVRYRADTALYINKKIAELQALILENGGN